MTTPRAAVAAGVVTLMLVARDSVDATGTSLPAAALAHTPPARS
jgi:hypothetical protein